MEHGETVKVHAKAVRSDDWWSVEVSEIDGALTQAKRLDQIPDKVADAVAVLTGTPKGQVEVLGVDYDFGDPGAMNDIADVKKLNRDAHQAAAAASQASRAAVRKLRNRGLSVRDVGTILQISPSRVSQLDNRATTDNQGRTS